MKNNQSLSWNLEGLTVIVVLLVFLLALPMKVYAQNRTETLQGQVHEFEVACPYYITGSVPVQTTNPLGIISISGDFKTSGNGKDTRYDVKKDNLTITYKFDKSILHNPGTKWHLIEDASKFVDGIDIKAPIKNGVIIVQTSLDRKNWVTDRIMTNAFTPDYDSSEALLVTKEIQLINGCYYKIIVAYEKEIITDSSQPIPFLPALDKKFSKKNAEVYEFYAENSYEKSLSDFNSKPCKQLGEKICVKADTGYSEQITIDEKNPHYGWELGTFTINGYTRETIENGNPLFLKNAGDKVTLWFKLSNNIDNLKGDGKLFIAEDTNGSDHFFELAKTNLKRGALIIRFTDHEGVKHDPIIYTDFLEANVTPGANTRAVLFEEGDYEVALNYTIGNTDFLAPENDYRIFFKFSIRNGNTMFFPFDLSTGAELRDKAITPDGFTIDMAKSRYLNINVRRATIGVGENGHSEDIRFNGPAKDGAKYTEEGIYTVDVTNRYTEEHTVKTFYVGTDSFMIAMAKSGKTVAELDEFLSQGYTIEADGSLVAPPEPEPEKDLDTKVLTNDTITSYSQINQHESGKIKSGKKEGIALMSNESFNQEAASGSAVSTEQLGIIGMLIVCGAIGAVIYKKKKNISSQVTSDSSDTESDENDQKSES